jgi:hypothetical protein
MSLTYTVEPDPSSADARWVIDRLVAFNESGAGSRNVRNFGIFARDQDGELLRKAGREYALHSQAFGLANLLSVICYLL